MEIPRIPDFSNPVYQNLINDIEKGTCIFLGAGVSKLAGYKLWRELCDDIIETFWKQRKKLYKENKKFTLSM